MADDPREFHRDDDYVSTSDPAALARALKGSSNTRVVNPSHPAGQPSTWPSKRPRSLDL